MPAYMKDNLFTHPDVDSVNIENVETISNVCW